MNKGMEEDGCHFRDCEDVLDLDRFRTGGGQLRSSGSVEQGRRGVQGFTA